MAVRRVTKTVVDRLPASGVVWDTDVRGFGVRRQQGDASYVLKVRVGTRQRFLTIGRHGAPWTPETARREARRLLGEIAAGRDPADARAARKHSPNFNEFADRYVAEHVLVSKKPRSAAEDRRNLARHILPAFGRRLITEITSADVAKFQASKSATPIAANRCLALMSHMFNMAERWGLRPRRSNPCEHVAKYRERARERMLSPEELARLGSAFATAAAGYPGGFNLDHPPSRRHFPEDWRAIAVVKLLIFTGARLSEVLGLRWDQVDFQRGIARLSDSKTGSKTIYLTEPAVEFCEPSHGSITHRSCCPAIATGRTIRAFRRLGGASAGSPAYKTSACTTCGTHTQVRRSQRAKVYTSSEKFWATPTPPPPSAIRIWLKTRSETPPTEPPLDWQNQ